MKETILKEKIGLRLCSYVQSDIVHYIITDHHRRVLKKYVPTATLKGNALRAKVFKEFEESEASMFFGTWPKVALDASEIEEGQILAYEKSLGNIAFDRVFKITGSLIFAEKHIGGESLWITSNLTKKIQEDVIFVIEPESVPEKYRTWGEH